MSLGEILLQRLFHVGVALMSGLFDGGRDVGWDLGVGIDFVNVDCAFAIEAAAGGDTFGVFGDIDSEDAAFKGREFEEEIGVVANLAIGVSEDAVEFGNAIGTSDDDFIAGGMADNGA